MASFGDGYGGNVLFIPSSAGGSQEAFIPGKIHVYSNARFNVITVNRPDHLHVPNADGKSWAAQADFASCLFECFGIGKAVVMSNCGGGPVAVQFAARHLDHTAPLILNVATRSMWLCICR